MGLLAIIRQERYRKRLTPIPFFFTFANAALGFLAVIQALEGNPIAATYCILAAGFMDVFDGRLARALGTTSMIGVELDSLVDGVSFCLAPAVILYTAYPGTNELFQCATLISYVCAGLYRLAKFNVHAGTSRSHYSGLPTPMAAFFVLGLVLHQEWLVSHSPLFFTAYQGSFLAIIAITLLMISPIPFKKHSAFSPHEIIVLLCSSIVGITCAHFYGYPWLLLSVALYIGIALSQYCYRAMRPVHYH